MAKRFAAVDAAIAAGTEPRAPKRARGLLLDVPDGRAVRLISEVGELTEYGHHFYTQTGQQAPENGVDRTQVPTMKGNRELIRLLNGRQATTRSWDNVKREWIFTRLGKKYYAESKDRYTVNFAVISELVRLDNSIYYNDEGYLPSTATALGEISVPTLMTHEQQLTEVKRQTREFLDALPVDDKGNKVLIEGGGSSAHVVLDERGSDSRGNPHETQYNKQEILAQPDGSVTVSAVMHRPLRSGKPWSFGFAGVIPEAYEETNGRCVPHQLEAVLNRTLGLREEDLEGIFDELQAKVYPPGSEESPYEIEYEDGRMERRNWRDCGVTVAMIQKFAEENCLSVHVLFGDKKVLSLTPQGALSSLCLHVRGDHCYCVNEAHRKSEIAQMRVSEPSLEPDAVLAVVAKNKQLPASEWQPWSGDASCPGHYFVDGDLTHTRMELHRQGLCPKVLLNNRGLPKALCFGKVVIHRMREDSGVCQKFAELFQAKTGRELVWTGESLGALLHRAFEIAARPPSRERLSEESRVALWSSQNRVCAMCGFEVSLKDFEVDHINPLRCGGDNREQNLQALCRSCHADKTHLEGLSFVEEQNPLRSQFSVSMYKKFGKSAKPPQMVASLHESNGRGAVSVDIRRCRLNAFLCADAWPIPIFSPIDASVPAVSGHLGDFNWIDKGPLGPRESPLSVAPYWGPAWYTKASAAYLLDAGIATWNDFKETLDASAHRPMSFAADIFKLEWDLLLEVGGSFVGHAFLEQKGCAAAGPEMLAKIGYVQHLGVMATPEHVRYKMETTSCFQDVVARSASVSPTPGSPLAVNGRPMFFDYITRQNVRQLSTMRAFHQHCLEQERLNVARMAQLARDFTRIENFLCIRTDELQLYVPKSVQQRFVERIESITYDKLHTVLPRGRRPALQRPNSSSEPVFRVKFLKEAVVCGGTLRIRDEQSSYLEDSRREWNHVAEPLEGPDEFTRHVVQRALEGGSFCLVGAAGCGKSVALRAVKAALVEQGLVCQCVALTHTAARNIGEGAQTAHGFAMRHVMHGTCPSLKVLLIDEMSFLSAELVAAFENLRLMDDVRIITFGDWNQLAPIRSRWRGCEIGPKAIENSQLLKDWSDAHRFELRRCRRSDQRHFDFCSTIKEKPLHEALSLAKARYPARAGPSLWNLTMSNYRRRKINREMQAQAAAAVPDVDKTWIDVEGIEDAFHIFVGSRLIGSNTTGKFINGAFLTVLALTSAGAKLRDDDTGEEFEASYEQIGKHFRLRWALTLFSVQGRSLPGSIAIWDTDSPHFTVAHLYVALSRAVDGGSVSIAC